MMCVWKDENKWKRGRAQFKKNNKWINWRMEGADESTELRWPPNDYFLTGGQTCPLFA